MRPLAFARSLHRAGRRRVACWGTFVSMFVLLVGIHPAQAADFKIESAIKKGYGWSGYWWPMLASQGSHLYDTQGAFTPLLKYGQLTGDYTPLKWEKQYGYTTDPKNNWWGHCNGWAAASLLYPEPVSSKRFQLPGGPVVDFNVGEIKGLLAHIHQYTPAYNGAGQPRYLAGVDHNNDLRAGTFHEWLLYYLWQRKEGVIFNITPKAEVWNFPCYAFRMTGVSDANDPSWTHVTTQIWYASDGVDPNFVGIKSLTKTFTYDVKGDPKKPEAANWTGTSVIDHPQFVWIPEDEPKTYDAAEPNYQAENPISVQLVKEMALRSAGTWTGTAP